jgi:hypothetical protein
MPRKQNQIETVWQPIPGSSQELALDSRCHHTLFTGARGPGKTDVQLMFFRKFVGMGYGAFWRGVIFDREYKNLDDLVNKSRRWFNSFGDGAKFHESKADYKWVWPTGEELLFRSYKTKTDYWNYHGQEFPFIGWNELCKYPTSNGYDDMMSCNRSSFRPQDYPLQNGDLLPPIPLRVFSTTNPYGAGHIWVKRRFIDVAPYGQVVRRTVRVFNPATKEDVDVTKSQVTIFGSWRENIYLSPEYIAELESITDENKRKAWLEGDWDIVAGGALDDVWRKIVHIRPRFIVPPSWYLDRSLDWGSTHPFAVGWFAEANGEEARLTDGTTFCPPPGSIIQLAEWYGTKEIGSNKGLKLSAPDIAVGIRDREIALMEQGWINAQPWPGPADNQIRDVREIDVDTIEKKMSDKGIRWLESDKSPGSRRNGLQLVRDRLEAATKGEGPGLYFMDNCRASISTLPVLPRDEDKIDDVDTDAEDHPYDMVRYRVLKGNNRMARAIKVKYAS